MVEAPKAKKQHALWLRLLFATTDLYALAVIMYVVLRLVSGERLWPVAMLNAFTPWFLFPAFVFTVLLLLLRQWLRAGLMAPGILIFLVLYGGFFLPPGRTASAEPAGIDLQVMSFNLAAQNHSAELNDYLRESGADIIALQEVSDTNAEYLPDGLAEDYPYVVLYGGGIPGIGLLSKYPIISHEIIRYPNRHMPNLLVMLDIDGVPLRVISAHPPPPGFSMDWRRFYITPAGEDMDMLAAQATDGPPTLLMGDFNVSDQSADYARIMQYDLQDAFREAGTNLGFTFPVGSRYGGLHLFRLVRIDYIFFTEHFSVNEAWIGPPDSASDHLPVSAKLTWNRQ